MLNQRILIVDDEVILCQSLKMALEDEGYPVEIANTGEDAVRKVPVFDPGVVLLDLRLPGMDGIQVLKKIKDHNPEINAIMITAYGDTQTTVEAIKLGAYDFINKPFELSGLKALIKNALEKQTLLREVEYLRYRQHKFNRYCDLVGSSSQMMEIYKQIETLAGTGDTTILIRGETGTGKELVAGAIHYRSNRNTAPFMEINCASLTESLLESELFGYEKGAFTDAKQRKKGLFEIADRGTIFLDEIGEIPLAIQAKLLRFLDRKQFKRLGSGRDIKVDVRVIAATNRNLETAIREGAFRQDLYYRLNVVSLNLPPLRERKDDILLLANYFLDEFCREMGKPPKTLSPSVTDIFTHYPWNGNVRELRNLIERIVIFAKGTIIEKDLLAPAMLSGCTKNSEVHAGEAIHPKGRGLDEMLSGFEKQIIEDALRQTGGNKTSAAEMLGVSRFSLSRRLEKLSATTKSDFVEPRRHNEG